MEVGCGSIMTFKKPFLAVGSQDYGELQVLDIYIGVLTSILWRSGLGLVGLEE